MSVPYYPQYTVTPILGLNLHGMDEVVAQNFIILDSAISGGGGGGTPGGTTGQVQYNNAGAFGGIAEGTSGWVLTSNGVGVPPSFQAASSGTSVLVNGSSISNPNFNNTTPAAPAGGVNVLWQVSGSNVSGYIPNVSGGPFVQLNPSADQTVTGSFGLTMSAGWMSIEGPGSASALTGTLVFGAVTTSPAMTFADETNDPLVNGNVYFGTPSAIMRTSIGTTVHDIMAVDSANGAICLTNCEGIVDYQTDFTTMMLGTNATWEVSDADGNIWQFLVSQGTLTYFDIVSGTTNYPTITASQVASQPTFKFGGWLGITLPGTATANLIAAKMTFDGSSTGSAAISVPAAAGTPNTLLLPIATGTAGYALITDGANPQQLSWANMGLGGPYVQLNPAAGQTITGAFSLTMSDAGSTFIAKGAQGSQFGPNESTLDPAWFSNYFGMAPVVRVVDSIASNVAVGYSIGVGVETQDSGNGFAIGVYSFLVTKSTNTNPADSAAYCFQADIGLDLPAGKQLPSVANYNSVIDIDGAGTITNLSFFSAENAFRTGGTSVVTNLHGLWIRSALSDATNNYGIRIADQGTGANTYAAWFEGGKVKISKADVSGLQLAGTSSGVISILTQAAAGTFNFNLPITAGSAGQVLTSQGGSSTAMTWTSVAAVNASVNATAQTASIGTSNLVASATAGVYRISYYMKITTAGSTSGSVTLTLSYTDRDDSVVVTYVVPTPANATDSSSVVSGTLIVDAKTATAITYATTYASSGTAMVYKLRLKCEAL